MISFKQLYDGLVSGEITIDENETESLNSNINVFFDKYIKILIKDIITTTYIK